MTIFTTFNKPKLSATEKRVTSCTNTYFISKKKLYEVTHEGQGCFYD